jgi:hypothetical protein
MHVAQFQVDGLIVTEELSNDNITASAKWLAEKPGKNIQAKGQIKWRDFGRGAGIVHQCPAHQEGCQAILLGQRRHEGAVRPNHLCNRGFVATRDQAQFDAP